MRALILGLVLVVAGITVAPAQQQGSVEDLALWCEAINAELIGSGQLGSIDGLMVEQQRPALSTRADEAVASLGLGAADAEAVRASYADEAQMQVADYFAGGRDSAAFRLDYSACG